MTSRNVILSETKNRSVAQIGERSEVNLMDLSEVLHFVQDDNQPVISHQSSVISHQSEKLDASLLSSQGFGATSRWHDEEKHSTLDSLNHDPKCGERSEVNHESSAHRLIDF